MKVTVGILSFIVAATAFAGDVKPFRIPVGVEFVVKNLTGIDASTQSSEPIVFDVIGIRMANNTEPQKLPLKCVIAGNAIPDLSSARVLPNPVRISCSNANTQIEAAIHAFFVGKDGKVGIPGKVQKRNSNGVFVTIEADQPVTAIVTETIPATAWKVSQ